MIICGIICLNLEFNIIIIFFDLIVMVNYLLKLLWENDDLLLLEIFI